MKEGRFPTQVRWESNRASVWKGILRDGDPSPPQQWSGLATGIPISLQDSSYTTREIDGVHHEGRAGFNPVCWVHVTIIQRLNVTVAIPHR